MKLQNRLLEQIDNPQLSRSERAILRCKLAKELEEAGKYEAATGALGDYWRGVSARPSLDNLDDRAKAEILLRVGVLTGWLGSARQITGAQDAAQDFISESQGIFVTLNDLEKTTEAQIELGYCYWRKGSFDEARALLTEVIPVAKDFDNDLEAIAIIRLANVEISTSHYLEAYRLLSESTELFEMSRSHVLKGNWHFERALAARNISKSGDTELWIDRALVDYAAAAYHYEKAGHTRWCARIENNTGFLFLSINKFKEAHEHLDRARKLFVSLRDTGSVAQVDETRAQVFLKEGKPHEAEKTVRPAVRELEQGGEQALIAEALTTYGTALARTGKTVEANAALLRSIEISELAGDYKAVGRASLCMVEELGEHLAEDRLRDLFHVADSALGDKKSPEMLARLLNASRVVIASTLRDSAPVEVKDFIYSDLSTQMMLDRAKRISRSHDSVLITGETGTGKEVLAHLIHKWSGSNGEFVPVNCAAIPEGLFESELFGHKRGSFTGANKDKIGLIKHSHGGTLFLDEIAELTITAQAKLLRVIERGEIQPVGASIPEVVGTRVIAATNRDLRDEVRAGRFREDLFFRLQSFHLEIPPLRERPEDVVAIARAFIVEAVERYKKDVIFTDEALDALTILPLKGNVRELRSLIERTILMAEEKTTISADAVKTVAMRGSDRMNLVSPWENFSLKEEVRRFERHYIELALRETGNKVAGAAKLLGFKHHELLRSMIAARHKDLLEGASPIKKRPRSIIKKK